MPKKSNEWVLTAFDVHADRLTANRVAVEGKHEATRCWCCGSSKKELQKCHIVPKSLGGPDSPNNLVPLCSLCHDEAPDVKDPEAIWTWIANQQNSLSGLGLGRLGDLWDALPKLIEKYDITTEAEGAAVLEWFSYLSIEKATYHMGQLKHSGSYVKDSTLLWITEEAMKRAKGIYK